MAGNALWFVALFAALYWLPGRLLVQLLRGEAPAEERLPVAIGLGLVVVNTPTVLVAGVAGLLGPFELSFAFVAVCSALVSLSLLAILRWRGVSPFRGWFRRPTKRLLALWMLTAGATGFFLVHYDRDVFWEEACMVRAAMGVNARTLREDLLSLYTGGEPLSVYQSDPVRGEAPNRNLFLTQNQGQRMGPTVLISPLLALFETFGFRVAYALQGLLLPGLGFLLGWYVLRRPWAAFAVAALLTFSPYALAQRTFDENFLASPFGMLALVLLLRPRREVFLAGMALGLFMGIREVWVLSLPLVLFYLWRTGESPKGEVGRLVAGAALFALPTIAVHVLFITVQGGTLLFQTFEQRPVPHSLLGWTFELPLFLNWPFVDEPLRSPYMAYAPIVAYPLDFLRRFGVLLVALLPAGLAWLFGSDRRRAWLLLAWVLPLVGFVMLQSRWVEPNKMGIPATVLGPVVLALVAGLAYLTDSRRAWKPRVALLLLGLALPLLLGPLLRSTRAPLDPRVRAYSSTLYDRLFPPSTVLYEEETPDYVEWERGRYDSPWLPRWTAADWRSALLARGAAQLAANLRAPGFAEYERSLPDYLEQLFLGSHLMVGPVSLCQALRRSGASAGLASIPFHTSGATGDESVAVLSLDLSHAPLLADSPFTWAESADPVRVDQADVTVIAGFRVPWSEAPQNLLLARDGFGTVTLMLIAGQPGWFAQPDWLTVRRIDATLFPDAKVPLALPEAEIVRLYEVRSFRPARWYVRTIRVEGGAVEISPASPMSPS